MKCTLGMVGGEKDDNKIVFVSAAAATVRCCGVPPILTADSIWVASNTDMDVGIGTYIHVQK